MVRRFRGQGGLSLVEATIILMVLMLLTGVFAPSIMDFVNDAKAVKVKEDCELIGINVVRLVRDVGHCLKLNGQAGQRCVKNNRVDILFSDGPDVSQNDLTGQAGTPFAGGGNIQAGNINWSDDNTSQADSMVHQWVTNEPLYRQPGAFTGNNDPNSHLNPKPYFNLGWRGAYIQSPIGPDPWGHRYLVNTVFLATAEDAQDNTAEGHFSKGWDRDVFCLSAGTNGRLETFFGGDQAGKGGIVRGGDDEAYPISGSTR